MSSGVKCGKSSISVQPSSEKRTCRFRCASWKRVDGLNKVSIMVPMDRTGGAAIVGTSIYSENYYGVCRFRDWRKETSSGRTDFERLIHSIDSFLALVATTDDSDNGENIRRRRSSAINPTQHATPHRLFIDSLFHHATKVSPSLVCHNN
jgi:hypothetical protein